MPRKVNGVKQLKSTDKRLKRNKECIRVKSTKFEERQVQRKLKREVRKEIQDIKRDFGYKNALNIRLSNVNLTRNNLQFIKYLYTSYWDNNRDGIKHYQFQCKRCKRKMVVSKNLIKARGRKSIYCNCPPSIKYSPMGRKINSNEYEIVSDSFLICNGGAENNIYGANIVFRLSDGRIVRYKFTKWHFYYISRLVWYCDGKTEPFAKIPNKWSNSGYITMPMSKYVVHHYDIEHFLNADPNEKVIKKNGKYDLRYESLRVISDGKMQRRRLSLRDKNRDYKMSPEMLEKYRREWHERNDNKIKNELHGDANLECLNYTKTEYNKECENLKNNEENIENGVDI